MNESLSQYDALRDCQYSQWSKRGELDCLEIRHPLFSADLLLQGAQLLHFAPTGQDNWLWLSEQALYQTGVAVRGGMPICWPWFGNAHDNPASVQQHIADPTTASAHGFARVSVWQLLAVQESMQESGQQVSLHLALPMMQNSGWLADSRLEVIFRLSAAALTVELTTQAGAQPITFSQALHSYFSTTDIHHTSILGFDGFVYADALQDWQQQVQHGPIRFGAETDRVYQANGVQRLVTPTRKMVLQSNSNSAVVWNPWVDKSARLSQCASDAWQRMFCVETANVMDDVVSLQAGQTYTLSLSIYCD